MSARPGTAAFADDHLVSSYYDELRRHCESAPREFFIGTPRGHGMSWLDKHLVEIGLEVTTSWFEEEQKKKRISTMVSAKTTPKDTAAPGWRLTSVRWLEENAPGTVRRTGGRPAAERLLGALEALRYGNAEEELKEASRLVGTAAELRARAVSRWDETEHRLMVGYINNGGYSARRSELLRTGLVDSRKIALETDDGSELPELEVVENGTRGRNPGTALTDGLPPSAEPEADEESLERAVAHSSALAGSW